MTVAAPVPLLVEDKFGAGRPPFGKKVFFLRCQWWPKPQEPIPIIYRSGFTNCPSPSFPVILPSCMTVLPRRIVRIGTPFTLRPW